MGVFLQLFQLAASLFRKVSHLNERSLEINFFTNREKNKIQSADTTLRITAQYHSLCCLCNDILLLDGYTRTINHYYIEISNLNSDFHYLDRKT